MVIREHFVFVLKQQIGLKSSQPISTKNLWLQARKDFYYPFLGRSPSKYNFFYHTTFRAVLGIVRGRDLVCRSKIYPDPKFVGKTKFLTKKFSTK